MSVNRRKPVGVRLVAVLVGGAALNVVLLALAGAIFMREFELQQHFLEAQRSPAAYQALAASFRAKDLWVDFVAIPIIGCLIGAYCGLLQKKGPAILAVGCLLPMFTYEVMTQPVRAWSVQSNLRYFGMRVLGFLLAMLAATLLRSLLHKKSSSSQTVSLATQSL